MQEGRLSQMKVRVRYPPSPTGFQHIGNFRTALFNYLFARSQGGEFILRIEDTDQKRFTPGAVEDLCDTLSWIGIEWDEGPDIGGPFGPYVQSERVDLYKEYAEKLLASGDLYRCYCSEERIADLRKEQESSGRPTGYDRKCRNLSDEEIAAREARGESSVLRLKLPFEGGITFNDKLIGPIRRRYKDLPVDPVLMKSDGFPTYHLAVVVDDHLMEISHVLRGPEWLASAPLHVHLYKAFGWESPVLCHLPMVLGKDGQKLGKRHGATSVREFREEGYLPQAILNYLALVGWAYDDKREFFAKKELEELFSLEKLNKGSAVFDVKKLIWFNGHYIREMGVNKLKDLLLPYLIQDGIVSDPPTERQLSVVDGAMPLVQERLRLLPDVSELVRFLLEDPGSPSAEELVPKKMDPADALALLREGRKLLSGLDLQNDEQSEMSFRQKAEQLDVKLGALLMPLRVAITGSSVSLPLFGSIRLLGTNTSIERVDRALRILEA